METPRLRSAEEDEPPGRLTIPSGQTLVASSIETDVRQDRYATGAARLTSHGSLRSGPSTVVYGPLRGLTLPNRRRFSSSGRTRAFRRLFYPEVSTGQWNDWHWQLRMRVRSHEQLTRFLDLAKEEWDALLGAGGTLPVAVTPYYLSLVDPHDPAQPLRRTVVPVGLERVHGPGEAEDPLSEDEDSPVPGLVHRYPDRVLFLVTGRCAANCRYCTRSRIVGCRNDGLGSKRQWEAAIDYIERTPEIRDVLVSGGDPLTLSDEKLDWILSRLRRIPHVELLRIGTKAPVVLPQRITLGLTRALRRHHPLWMSIHFTHPDELTPEVELACNRLADAGIPLGSQTVLLSGINDSVETMRDLMHGLVRMRVRPYYLYQCDPIPGSAHFRTPVEKGLEIIEGLRGHTTGYAVPTFVIDAPGGGGKIPLLPQYSLGRSGGDLLIRNYQGRIFRYPEVVV